MKESKKNPFPLGVSTPRVSSHKVALSPKAHPVINASQPRTRHGVSCQKKVERGNSECIPNIETNRHVSALLAFRALSLGNQAAQGFLYPLAYLVHVVKLEVDGMGSYDMRNQLLLGWAAELPQASEYSPF